MEISKSNRIHIGLFGRTNVGKSTISNLTAGQTLLLFLISVERQQMYREIIRAVYWAN